MEHRRTLSRRPYVLPDWLIVVTVLGAIGATVFLGLLGADRYLLTDDDVSAEPSATPSASVDPEPSPEPEPTATTPEPTPTETTPAVARDAQVSVFNNTAVAGIAGQYADRARAAGWEVTRVSNWNGVIPENTVYFPPGFEEQAQLLAEDLEITRVMPSVTPMRIDGLTVILSGPQGTGA